MKQTGQRCYIYTVRPRLQNLAVLGAVAALVSGCGGTQVRNSVGADFYPSLQKADNELGRAIREAGPAQSLLTRQEFAKLTRTPGFTTAAQAKIATRVHQAVLADRMTAATASAALSDANRAAKLLALIAIGMPTSNHFPPGALAYALSNISSDEAAYRRTLAKEAALSERIAPVFTAEAVVERAWERQFKKGAFPSRKAAKAALQRSVEKALAPGIRLMSRDDLLQLMARHASRNLSSDLSTLRFELRNDTDVRRTAARLKQEDPKGFLAEGFRRSN
jgi:hypothetical protein